MRGVKDYDRRGRYEDPDEPLDSSPDEDDVDPEDPDAE